MTAAATTITAGSWQGFLGRGLAERELQCVLGVAQGQSSKELGRDLGIAADSVKKRIKLQVNRRAALVGEAMKRGLISPAAILAAILAVHGAVSDDQFLRVRRSGGSERKVELRAVARRVEQQVALA
ncbi:helix-turn-helix transcriptional regulator [Pseudomonas asiatica]|uniref:helix-turn-helix transcriptional regulator n=1 Tax=Pseudomonas asiatica TaxID=2219225 RepID=UPI001E4B72B7|nr:helix-turn-helix transcriptional regulator [Pseudomonas asiatica]MCE1099482.1 helix-turn-helix transcriptional regulator [Pseudomonas asiatica]MCE1104957.1 helix-turn-helix transcriptional regulator [Pseudomonas asiatica]